MSEKRRITVSLSSQQYDLLKDISENTGQSMSAFIFDLIEHSMPVFLRMASTFRRIKHAQDVQKKRIVQGLDEAQTAIEPLLGEVLGQFDLFCDFLEGESGVEKGVESVVTTPTNRGVTTPVKKEKKIRKDKELDENSGSKKKSKVGGKK